MIARIWRGTTRVEDAEAYVRYLEETGFRAFRKTSGNVGALGLRRILADKAEFLVVSFWESEGAIRNFAGDAIDRAVFYDEDERFLLDRDTHVSHFEVVHRDEPARIS
jgi:heme-degrading monooxygenase HmoA